MGMLIVFWVMLVVCVLIGYRAYNAGYEDGIADCSADASWR